MGKNGINFWINLFNILHTTVEQRRKIDTADIHGFAFY